MDATVRPNTNPDRSVRWCCCVVCCWAALSVDVCNARARKPKHSHTPTLTPDLTRVDVNVVQNILEPLRKCATPGQFRDHFCYEVDDDEVDSEHDDDGEHGKDGTARRPSSLSEPVCTLTFPVTRSDQSLVVPEGWSGSHVPVSFEHRHLYADLLERTRLEEGRVQIEAMRRGLHALIPVPLLSLYVCLLRFVVNVCLNSC